MKKALAACAAALMLGAAGASFATLPPAPAKSDAEKAADAQKKAKDAADLAKAEDKAVANYKKHQAARKK